ncbi:MAG: alkyl sulfatase dimerization domain-containing protein [bacterium]
MKTLLISVFSVLVLISSATAFEPATVAIHPLLDEMFNDFHPPAVFTAVDGVYVARGYNRDNPILIEGPSGLIVIDPGESIIGAGLAKDAFNAQLDNIFDRKPVKAVIYTHSHDCHIHGASVFAGPQTEIIAHENLMATLYSSWFSQLYPSRIMGAVKMGGLLFYDDPGWYRGLTPHCRDSFPGESGFLPPTQTFRDTLKTTVAGVKLEMFFTPGETNDMIVVWLPVKKTLVQIGNFYNAIPAITTLRGGSLRDPMDYITSIDFYRGLNPECMVFMHGPYPVLQGKEEISKTMTNYRDAIQFIHDQTVHYMNKGLTPGEIKELVKLPPDLASDPFLQETYGEIDRNIYYTFWRYRGYFTGKCRDLITQSPIEEAQMAAMLAEGVDKLAAKAQEALDNGKWEWALELADDVLLLDPANSSARSTKNTALIALAGETINSQSRNYLLSEYLLESGQIPPVETAIFSGMYPKLIFASMDDNAVRFMPMDALHRILAVNINAVKSLDTDMAVGLQLTDIPKNSPTEPSYYALHVRHCILEVAPEATPKAGSRTQNGEFRIITDSPVWKDLVLGKLTPQEAVSSAKVVIDGGDPEAFYAFMDLFD